MWLGIMFDPIVDIPSMISSLNVGCVYCERVETRQCVFLFGTAEELAKIKYRFEVIFKTMKKWEGFERDLTFEIGLSESKSLFFK